MNPKIFVFIAVLILMVILAGIILVGPTLQIGSQNGISETSNITLVEPLQVELANLSVSKISERIATIDIAFKISNPNPRAVIVQTMDYQLYATAYSDDEQIAGGEIGSRPTGMVEFGSNYYVLLGDNSITLKETITLRGSENTPELWTVLRDDSTSWRVTGDVFYNLSSMTSGQENELHFEFTK
jgi:LEA14-like dessication related protein